MLETTWFIIWGVLWAVYFLLDGFDFGAATLMPFLAKDERDRKSVIGSIGPFWDGNEVWLITAGGVTFAAFPKTYAIMFSAMYSPLMLVLFMLIFRGVAIEFRGKVASDSWRGFWDGVFVSVSAIAAILFGVAFGNIFRGIPFDGAGVFHGNLITFLNPYSLAGGALFLSMFLVHGSLWLSFKTTGELSERALACASKLWPLLLIVTVCFLVWTKFETKLWNNYFNNPALFVLPAVAVAGLVSARVFIASKSAFKAWVSSSVFIVAAVMFGVVGLFPDMLPSSMDPSFSLTAVNSASTPMTLKIMLCVALTLVPIVIAYQTWVMFFFKDSATSASGEESGGY